MQRVQEAPRTKRAMAQLLHMTQAKSGGGWVGSSLVHLGDSNVPNALMFIDKYSQVRNERICIYIYIYMGGIVAGAFGRFERSKRSHVHRQVLAGEMA